MKYWRALFPIVPAVLAMHPVLVKAELTLCGGVWVNRSCDSDRSVSLPEVDSKPPTPEQLRAARVQRWLQELQMKAFDARREYELEVSTKPVEELCLLESTSDKQCLLRISEEMKNLDKLLQQERRIAKEQSKAQETPSPMKQQEENQTVITVIRDPLFHCLGNRCQGRKREPGGPVMSPPWKPPRQPRAPLVPDESSPKEDRGKGRQKIGIGEVQSGK